MCASFSGAARPPGQPGQSLNHVMLLMPTLAGIADEITGIDLVPPSPGLRPRLAAAA